MQTQMAAPQQQAVMKVDPRQMDLKRLLEGSKSAIASVVPKHLTAERLVKVALLATSKSPDLLKCSANSILQSVMQAAELGLEVNSPLGQAYLIAFKNKLKDESGREQWVTECQLQIGYRGYIELAKRSGQIDMVEARCVYANDFFDVVYGTEQRLIHKPAMQDPGPLKCVYAIARIKGCDLPQIDVLTLRDIEYARSISKTGRGDSPSGPWRDRYDEMARKTAVRRLAKYLPLSPELANAMDMDDRDSELQVAAIDVEEAPVSEKLARKAATVRKPERVEMASDNAETPAARFYRLMNEVQTIEELDRVLADAQATLKGADLNSAENYAQDRRAALAGRSE